MPDQFDIFLAAALAPDERPADRAFTLRVNARIALDQKLRAERSRALRELGLQTIALLAVAAALVWFFRSDAIAGLAAGSPSLTLAGLMLIFALLVALLIRPARADPFTLVNGS